MTIFGYPTIGLLIKVIKTRCHKIWSVNLLEYVMRMIGTSNINVVYDARCSWENIKCGEGIACDGHLITVVSGTIHDEDVSPHVHRPFGMIG